MSIGVSANVAWPIDGRTSGVTGLDERRLYERVGGGAFFTGLVERFYAGVETDPVLRPMYPTDLAPARERLAKFLIQYFGGPRDYEALRGEPRLRMRHARFPVDRAARDAWVSHMRAALEAAVDLAPRDREELWTYLTSTATFLVNRGGLSIVGSPGDGP